jgi:hypothetical protein
LPSENAVAHVACTIGKRNLEIFHTIPSIFDSELLYKIFNIVHSLVRRVAEIRKQITHINGGTARVASFRKRKNSLLKRHGFSGVSVSICLPFLRASQPEEIGLGASERRFHGYRTPSLYPRRVGSSLLLLDPPRSPIDRSINSWKWGKTDTRYWYAARCAPWFFTSANVCCGNEFSLYSRHAIIIARCTENIFAFRYRVRSSR